MVNLRQMWERLVGVPQANNPLDDRFYPATSGGGLSRAGVNVSPDTAMKVSAVYRCVSILANVLAMFPKGMYERLPRGRKEAPDHPLDPYISFKPNRRQNAFVFWRQVCYHLVLRQNAYVQILPGRPGRAWVGGLVPLHPDRVRGPEELEDGRLRYVYTRADGEKFTLIGDIDIWHLQGLSDDGLKGLSLMDVAGDSIGVSLAAEHHQANFFARGVKATGVLQTDKSFKAETAKEMGESFGRLYGGNAGAGKTPVLWEGMKFNAVSLNLKDQEFLDSRKFSVAEIARWFGVPPHMVGDVERSTSWGTGIEQQGLHFLIYSLLPWIELLEQSIRFSLVVSPERYYPKLNPGALLRMDQETQAAVMGTLIDKGVLSPNECRELLDRNPRAGGDEYVDVTKKPAPPPPRPALPGKPPDDDEIEEEDDQAEARAAETAGRLARGRAMELSQEEGWALDKIERQHPKGTPAWRSAVTGFYGRFARRIADTEIASLLKARSWCAARRDLALGPGGLPALTTDHPATFEALTGGLHVEG